MQHAIKTDYVEYVQLCKECFIFCMTQRIDTSHALFGQFLDGHFARPRFTNTLHRHYLHKHLVCHVCMALFANTLHTLSQTFWEILRFHLEYRKASRSIEHTPGSNNHIHSLSWGLNTGFQIFLMSVNISIRHHAMAPFPLLVPTLPSLQRR